ncbi:hypothetical protein GCM10009133_04770 [Cocleimonas flava]|jgi:LAS superfamily LD-carboxypeptidase LdcB|uniref:D-alanyl-D-alanine carboxypeptidase-like protein n=2 Tax=Cocleimonas flava TaxID=634765 RepID=A0A4R1EY84_9GAMM|nr:M15 family metallopeptidase [Cocleimonas flava]TCJ86846.1 D-alanyl-D-alanine carboxypeptidase-like protein [Cocleimonas flava]
MLPMTKIIIHSVLLACLVFGVSSSSAADTTHASKSVEHKQVVDYLTGRFQPSKHPAFSRVPKKYANRSGFYLRTEAYNAFQKMHAAAKKQGINLVIRSATRNFTNQHYIWERKWKSKSRANLNASARALNILKFSSMPGTSRHHWGTEIDINSFNNSWFTYGEGLRLFNWMNNNAAKYGFHRPYTAKNKNRPNGYNEEKWHWSYTPLSIPMLRDAYQALSNDDIRGFSGSNTASKIGIKENYILGVDKSCQ